MDHKVSKDMISSGMTAAGEKTQADLGRTQYGSAPSPSKLMDAYKSMYDKKEEVINEHHKKDADGNTIPHEGEEIQQIDELSKTTTANYLYHAKVDKNYVHGGKMGKYQKARDKGLERAEKKLGSKISKKVKSDAQYDTSTMKRDPNESEFPRKYKVKEGADLFDAIATHFIDEGYEEKEVYKAMANLTEDQLQNLHEFPALGAIAAALKGGAAAAKIGAVAGKVGAAGAKVGAFASKAGAVASKGLASAGKAIPTSVKNVGKTIAKNVTTNPTQPATRMVGMGPNTGGVGQSLKSATKQNLQNIPKRVAAPFKAVSKAPGQIKNLATKAKDTFKNMSTFEKLQTAQTVKGVTSSVKPQGLEKKSSSRNISASADLFDIVKGKLLDEGLSIEEIKDIMLTLTPDEILNEISADLLKSAAKGAEAARGKAAVAGNTELAKKKLGQSAKFSDAMKSKNLEKSRSENMRKPTQYDRPVSKPQPDPTKPYPGTPR